MDECPIAQPVKPQLSSFKDRIARIYYSHGLFCSSHPYSVIVTTLVILSISCYPLLRLPHLGSSSQHFTTPLKDYVVPELSPDVNHEYKFTTPRWYQGPPVGYIQQIVVKVSIFPWQSDLILTDAFRGPLSEAFIIWQLINNHQTNSSHPVSLSNICFQVSEPVDMLAYPFLPHFQCLVVSPTNIWENNYLRLNEDPDFIKSVFSVRDSSVDSTSLREILFGVPWKETSMKQFMVRSRPRVLTYAFTIIFQKFHSGFIHSIESLLKSKFTSDPYPENTTYEPGISDISHVYFQDLHALAEFIPLGVAYTILFLYIYFSVRKIELVRSKWALAISAVMTVMMSLFMSVGLCVWFGLNPTLNSSEILPYLIVVIGLENMLVLTKSVVSTPVHLDVKLRVAQGLSKEGWSITKNLLTELLLLTIAFLTFVPKIQEFCLFAVVGLLTDFFLQLVFFATFLSIDIRRMEISDLHRGHHRRNLNDETKFQYARKTIDSTNIAKPAKHSQPISSSLSSVPSSKRKSSANSTDTSAKIFAPSSSNLMIGELPKRMKFIYFWARTRIVQRGLMICLVIWIFFWAYSSSIIEKLSENTFSFTFSDIGERNSLDIVNSMNERLNSSDPSNTDYSGQNFWSRLKHQNLFLWQSLSPQHWTKLFGYYNVSLSGRYVSILPPLHVSIAMNPSLATDYRTNADIDTSKKSYWKFLSSVEKADKDIDDQLSPTIDYYASSPVDTRLAIMLAIPTFFLFIYIMVVLYRCMCTRHYAEWRSSWKNSKQSTVESRRGSSTSNPDHYLITETLPIKLHMHSHEIESIVSDDNVIISSCLNCDICVWDAVSGDCLTSIKRSRLTRRRKNSHSSSFTENSCLSSDSTYSSSPTSDKFDPYAKTVHPDSTQNSPLDTQQFFFDEKGFGGECTGPCNGKYGFAGIEFAQEDVTQSFSEMRNSFRRGFSVEEREDIKRLFYSPLPFQPIWCMDYSDSCIAVGCKNGRLEVWNAFSGNLEYVHDDHKSGITALSIYENRLVAARLSGIVDFYSVECLGENSNCIVGPVSRQVSERPSSIHCTWLHSVKAHTLTVSALKMDNCFVVTGGFDRLVKVFKSDSAASVYTLHGHSFPISALHLDKHVAASAVSGCESGLICLWDLMTGTCMYSLKGHQGEVMRLSLTSIYMISQGTDDRICIWEKFQGHLLHSISQEYTLHSCFVLLTDNIMVTTKEDNLLLWDVNHGEALRMIMVGSGDHSCPIKLLKVSGQSIVCDYGPQMFIVNFPAITDKLD